MSRHGFSVAYDVARDSPTMAMDEMPADWGHGAQNADLGSRDHSIDVETLAPALLAFGKLIREANAEINGKRATARVLVVSDFEHKCFNINFDVLVSWYEQLKTFLDKDEVATAKTIIEWLMAGGAVGMAARKMSFFGYLEWRRGRKVTEVKPLTDKDSSGLVEVHVEGEGNSVTVNQHVYQLSRNPRALRAARSPDITVGPAEAPTKAAKKEALEVQFLHAQCL